MDLHEIYEGNIPGKPVFELSRADKERKLNLFQLVIQLEFIDLLTVRLDFMLDTYFRVAILCLSYTSSLRVVAMRWFVLVCIISATILM